MGSPRGYPQCAVPIFRDTVDLRVGKAVGFGVVYEMFRCRIEAIQAAAPCTDPQGPTTVLKNSQNLVAAQAVLVVWVVFVMNEGIGLAIKQIESAIIRADSYLAGPIFKNHIGSVMAQTGAVAGVVNIAFEFARRQLIEPYHGNA